MGFPAFLECIAAAVDASMDVHLLPQSSILCLDGQLIPNFIGRLESIESDWQQLKIRLKQERLPSLGSRKNRRRSDDHGDVGQYFSDPGLVQLVVDRYGDDLDLFYGDVELQDLSRGHLS